MVGLSNNKIQKNIMGQIPSIPHVLLKLIEACHKVDVSFEERQKLFRKMWAMCEGNCSGQPAAAHNGKMSRILTGYWWFSA